MSNWPITWTYNDFIKNNVNEMGYTTKSDIELPPRNLSQRWRRYGHDAKRRVFERFSKWCPKGTATSNLFIYLKTDQTFPEFVLKSFIGFFGGIVLTYLCFVFFVFQLSISLIHATIMSSIIGVLLTFGLAFSYRIRCLVFLLIPQLFSRVGRYTLTCYALILILTGPATNTLKNSEVLTESLACTQEQIKMDVKQITDSVKNPFSSMRDTIKLMIRRLNEIAREMDEILAKISRLVRAIVDVIQSSYIWLYTVIEKCNEKFGTPYEHCIKVLTHHVKRRSDIDKQQRMVLPNNSYLVKAVCSAVHSKSQVCVAPDYDEESIAATIKRKLRTFINRVKAMFLVKIHMRHSYTFTTSSSGSASQVTAGVVTEIRNRADLLLTWLSWSSCITSLFLLLIIFRAKYYQHMFETRSRFDNRYITKELRDINLQRLQEGRETVLPLNRRERAKYVTTTSFRLVASEKVHLTRSLVFMAITTFKLMIHMIADYSLYWVLTTIRYHGKRQTVLPPGPIDADLVITGTGLIADIIRSIFKALLTPISEIPTPTSCLPDPYPPDLKRYVQIGVLIFLLWFFALFEPYGLRLRHLIMGHYRPERAIARADWLYNHILRTRGSFMKFARRKLHKEFKCLPQETLTFRYLLRTRIPFRWLRYILGIAPVVPKCLLCNAKETEGIPDTELIRCETRSCPGTFCNSCFTDIGRLCTICLSPVDYGDFSDISLEKGSSEDSDDSSSQTDTTYLLPKRKYFLTSNKSVHSYQQDKVIGNMDKYNIKKPRFYSSTNQNNKNNNLTAISYSSDEETEENKTLNKYLLGKPLDFTYFSPPKSNLTVGYAYHNYFCDAAFNNISKDNNPRPSSNCKHYGATKKINGKQQIEKPKISKKYQSKPLQRNPTSLKEENIDIIQLPEDITTNNKVATICTTQEKKKYRRKLKSRARTFKRKRMYLRKPYNRYGKKLLNKMKQKLSRIRGTISPVVGIIHKLRSSNIKFNVYDIKRSSSAISVSKIAFRSIKHCRKSIRRKTNIPEISEHGARSNLQENINKPERGNNIPWETGNDRGNGKINICGKKDKLPKKYSKKTGFKNCFSKEKIRKLLSAVTIIRFKKGKGYTQKKAKVKAVPLLKYSSHNYKRRKKYLDRNRNKDNITNNAREIRNDNEIARTYRICSFLKEGDWWNSQFERVPSDHQKKDLTVNHFEDYYAGIKDYLQRIKKENVSRASEQLCCTSNYNEIADMPTKENCKSGEELIYHAHLPLLSARNSHKEIEDIFVKDLKLSPWKSYSLKNAKLYISNKFLHLKFGSPLNVLKTFFSTISLKKDKILTSEIILRNDKETVDKQIAASPETKSCTCQCEIIKHPMSHSHELYRLASNPKLCYEYTADKHTQTEKESTEKCSCATQDTTAVETLHNVDHKEINDYDSFIHDLYKGYDKPRGKGNKSYRSDSTRTDTTLCSCITVDYIDETPRKKNKKANKKIKVVTKSNQSTATEKTNVRNASTVTSDWWSPIVEKKEIDYKSGDDVCKRRDKRLTKTLNKRLVTFKSRTQVIPNEESYILSPSRYLLESQKYYNELFSPRFYSPHLFPVNRTTRVQRKANVFTNRVNKSHKTKRLEHQRSSVIKLSPRRVDINTRSDETFTIIH